MFRTKLIQFNNLIKVNNSQISQTFKLSTKVDRLRSLKFVDVKTLKKVDLTADESAVNSPIKLRGWISSTTKSMKNLTFFHLNDGLSNEDIQVVLTRDLENSLDHNLVYGTSIICEGNLVPSKGKQQSIEFRCNKIEFANETDHFPFHSKESNDQWGSIRQHPHLRFKTKHFASLQRVRGKLFAYIHEHLQSQNFLNVTTPIITRNDCEGGGEAFQVITSADKNANFFGQKPVYLTVSGQLHLETAVQGVNRVYTLSPCFRSEHTISRKHLSEFQMLELEESFLDSLDILLDRCESLCKNLVKYLIDECKDDLELILTRKRRETSIENLVDKDYKRITYEDALNLINEKSSLPKLDYGSNFNTTYETFLTEHFDNLPIFITHFPSFIKPFYMKTKFDKALNFDLIYPICGEVAGGSLREDNFETIEKSLEVNNINDLEWYKELRKQGSLPHGGFGLGIDRFVQSVLGLPNIRDVVPFPRWIHHCKC